MKPLFECFQQIIIHEMVYNELDEDTKRLVDLYKGKNVTIVDEGDLYGKDPQYTTVFNVIANHERVMYTRGNSKDRGEVYSLAYAAHNKIVTVQDTHYPKMKSGFPEIAFLIAS